MSLRCVNRNHLPRGFICEHNWYYRQLSRSTQKILHVPLGNVRRQIRLILYAKERELKASGRIRLPSWPLVSSTIQIFIFAFCRVFVSTSRTTE